MNRTFNPAAASQIWPRKREDLKLSPKWRDSLAGENNIIYDDSVIESRDSTVKARGKDWRSLVKGILKAELKRRNLSYGDLAERLRTIGVKDNERNIANKIARGSFTAVFFVQCMEAIGCRTIHLGDV